MLLRKSPEVKRVKVKKDSACQPLIEKLLQNRLSLAGLEQFRRKVTADDLSDIIQRIYDLNEKYILELSAVEGYLHKMNELKNAQRNKRFYKKIKNEFRDAKQNGNKKIILAEGDSWFNYPIILTDLIDRIIMEKDFAVYSVAAGGDWLLNMLSARQYIEELSLLHPDVFLISGGGNDLVGSSRLAAMLEPLGKCEEFSHCELAMYLIENANAAVSLNRTKFDNGVQYLSKDFFALLMFFHLQYYFLMSGILRNASKEGDKFYPIKIITQGYDYPIPSFNASYGWNPFLWYVPFIRNNLGHGGWLKKPMLMRGVTRQQDQEDIVYAMIYLFNEMMIHMGKILNEQYGQHVFHVDSRGSVGKGGWADELHPRPEHFIKTGEVFIHCINESIQPTYPGVFVVNKIFPAK